MKVAQEKTVIFAAYQKFFFFFGWAKVLVDSPKAGSLILGKALYKTTIYVCYNTLQLEISAIICIQ